jgi:hypothetical protein
MPLSDARAAQPLPVPTKVDHETRWYINAIAGAASSCLAKASLAPFQRISVKAQLGTPMNGIVGNILDEKRLLANGTREPLALRHFGAFFKGVPASMIQRVPYAGVQLAVYDRVKFSLNAFLGVDEKDTVSRRAVTSKLVASGIAASISGTVAYPLEVIRTRQMSGAQDCRTMGDAFRTISRDAGVVGFYKGLGATLLQRIPDIIINYTIYESVRFTMAAQGYSKGQCIAGGGTAAALTAIAVSYPLDTARRRLAAGKSAGGTVYRNTFHCLQDLYATRGVRAWYAGGSVEALRCVPQVILMWYLIELFREKITALDDKYIQGRT